MLGDPLAPGTSPSLHSPCVLSRLRPGHGSANVASPRKTERGWEKLLSHTTTGFQALSPELPTPFLPL